MRELTLVEKSLVSGAGTIKDHPGVQNALDAFDKMISSDTGAPVVDFAIGNGKNTVELAVSIMDAAFTRVFNNLISRFGF